MQQYATICMHIILMSSPFIVYLGNLVYVQYVLGYLLPLTKGIDHDLRCSYTKLLSRMVMVAKHP